MPFVKAETLQAIQVLREKLRALEDEAAEWKKTINRLYVGENEPAPYPDATANSSGSLGPLRSDQFYGSTLAEAAQEYLERRKSAGLGSASVNDIYKSLKDGGYKFDTSNEANAKNGVRISLRKNATIFHQLPNGDYGLCEWYGVKGQPVEEKPKKRGGKHRKHQKAQPPKSPELQQNGQPNTQDAMRGARGGVDDTGAITVGQFESFVREKNRHLKDVADHFNVSEATVTKLLEPESRVYLAQRGWLKIRPKTPETTKT